MGSADHWNTFGPQEQQGVAARQRNRMGPKAGASLPLRALRPSGRMPCEPLRGKQNPPGDRRGSLRSGPSGERERSGERKHSYTTLLRRPPGRTAAGSSGVR